MTKAQIQVMMLKYLKSKGYSNVKSTNMYVIAEGELPVCLCAHMDTVFSKPPREFFFDRDQTILWSPDGLGTDDRAGIYALIMLIERGYKPSIILTDLEEKGGQGAYTLVQQYPDCPFPDCRALIQLDRQGKEDCVFYDCDNEDFTKLIESYGFKEDIGTFTDISIFAPAWEIAAVNLSVGYVDEHTHVERLCFEWLEETIDKVENMLKDCGEWMSYVYIPAPKTPFMYAGPTEHDPTVWWITNTCCYCGKHVKDTEGRVIAGERPDGADSMLLCDDCYNRYKDYLK